MKSDMYTSILNDIYDNKELELLSARGKKKKSKEWFSSNNQIIILTVCVKHRTKYLSFCF